MNLTLLPEELMATNAPGVKVAKWAIGANWLFLSTIRWKNMKKHGQQKVRAPKMATGKVPWRQSHGLLSHVEQLESEHFIARLCEIVFIQFSLNMFESKSNAGNGICFWLILLSALAHSCLQVDAPTFLLSRNFVCQGLRPTQKQPEHGLVSTWKLVWFQTNTFQQISAG